MAVDVEALADGILAALQGELGGGFADIAGFAREQARRLAAHAEMIARARLSGPLRDDDDLFAHFTGQLAQMTANFARAVAELTLLTIQRAWNAIAEVVWGALNGALGAAGLGGLAIPALPGGAPG